MTAKNHFYIKAVLDSSKSQVDQLVSEFNVKKSARQKQNTRRKNTGVLNPSKLHSFKTEENIFLSKKVSNDGTSHGFFVLLDWSGSMSENNLNIKMLEQVISFSSFCDRVRVPYEILTYTTSMENHDLFTKKTESLSVVPDIRKASLLRIMSSSFSPSEKKEALDSIDQFLSFSYESAYNYRSFNKRNRLENLSDSFQKLISENHIPETKTDEERDSFVKNNRLRHMGGTPTLQSLLVVENMMGHFKKKTMVEKVNLLLITDGECGSLNFRKKSAALNSSEPVQVHWEKSLKPYRNYAVDQVPLHYRAKRDQKYSPYDRLKTSEFSVDIGGIINTVNQQEDLDKLQDLVEKDPMALVPERMSGLGLIFSVMRKKYNANIVIFYLYGSKASEESDMIKRIICPGYIYGFNAIDKADPSIAKIKISDWKRFILKQSKSNKKGQICIPGLHGADKFIGIQDVPGDSNELVDDSLLEGKKCTPNAISKALTSSSRKRQNSKFLAKEVMEVFG